MGSESPCTLERDRRTAPGTALLESDHLLFRAGDERVKVMLADVTRADAREDALLIETSSATLTLRLPAGTAGKWLAKIRNPRNLLDKLGVKEGMKVVVLSVRDPDFLSQLEGRIGAFSTRTTRHADLVFFGVETLKGLDRLGALRDTLVPNGAIWVVRRKGKEASLRDIDVFAAARRAGLVDNKVAAFSITHTAERLVILRSDR
ncbi:MAG: DUF3052 domain-containing protein [Gemmatimonadota bacterium]